LREGGLTGDDKKLLIEEFNDKYSSYYTKEIISEYDPSVSGVRELESDARVSQSTEVAHAPGGATRPGSQGGVRSVEISTIVSISTMGPSTIPWWASAAKSAAGETCHGKHNLTQGPPIVPRHH